MSVYEKTPFRSEELEYVCTYIIGLGWRRVEEMKEVFVSDPDNIIAFCALANELIAFWDRCETAQRMIIACDGATHASIAMGNEMRRIRDYVISVGKVDPMFNKEEFKTRQFDFSHLL